MWTPKRGTGRRSGSFASKPTGLSAAFARGGLEDLGEDHGLVATGSRFSPTVEIHDSCGREESGTGRDEARQLEPHAEPRGDSPVAHCHQNRWHEDDQKGAV